MVKSFIGDTATIISKALQDAEKQVTKACINTVNIQAGMTRKESIQNIQRNFTLRNSFTQNSIRYTSCPKSVQKLEDIESRAGVTTKASYMERQEKGGLHKNSNGRPLPIPTDYARGGNRSKLVRRAYRIPLQTVKGELKKHGTKNSEFVARAYVAQRESKVLRHNNQLFRITHFKKNGDSIHFRMNELYTFKYIQTRTEARPWLKPAVDHAIESAQKIFNQQMDKL